MKPRRPTHLWKILAGIMLCSVVGSATLWVLPDSTIRLGEAGTLRARAAAARSFAPIGSTPEFFAYSLSPVPVPRAFRTEMLPCPEAAPHGVHRVVLAISRARAPPSFA